MTIIKIIQNTLFINAMENSDSAALQNNTRFDDENIKETLLSLFEKNGSNLGLSDNAIKTQLEAYDIKLRQMTEYIKGNFLNAFHSIKIMEHRKKIVVLALILVQQSKLNTETTTLNATQVIEEVKKTLNATQVIEEVKKP